MRGSKRWLRRRRASSERYQRVYGYVTEERLRRWRVLHQTSRKALQDALSDRAEPREPVSS